MRTTALQAKQHQHRMNVKRGRETIRNRIRVKWNGKSFKKASKQARGGRTVADVIHPSHRLFAVVNHLAEFEKNSSHDETDGSSPSCKCSQCGMNGFAACDERKAAAAAVRSDSGAAVGKSRRICE